MVNLIKSLNDSLKPKDPVTEAMKKVLGDYDATYLDDEQVEMLADYMKEMFDSSKKRGQEPDLENIAAMALEDVSGFETAPAKVHKATIQRLVAKFHEMFG